MAKIMDPVLSILSILGYWAIILGTFGGPGSSSWPLREAARELATSSFLINPLLDSTLQDRVLHRLKVLLAAERMSYHQQ